MARKKQSEFHKSLQGNTPETLISPLCRAAITTCADSFHCGNDEDIGALCSMRDHVNSLIAAYRDLSLSRQQGVLKDIEAGKYKGSPDGGLAAMKALDTTPITLSDLHAEIERQGIPEF